MRAGGSPRRGIARYHCQFPARTTSSSGTKNLSRHPSTPFLVPELDFPHFRTRNYIFHTCRHLCAFRVGPKISTPLDPHSDLGTPGTLGERECAPARARTQRIPRDERRTSSERAHPPHGRQTTPPARAYYCCSTDYACRCFANGDYIPMEPPPELYRHRHNCVEKEIGTRTQLGVGKGAARGKFFRPRPPALPRSRPPVVGLRNQFYLYIELRSTHDKKKTVKQTVRFEN